MCRSALYVGVLTSRLRSAKKQGVAAHCPDSLFLATCVAICGNGATTDTVLTGISSISDIVRELLSASHASVTDGLYTDSTIERGSCGLSTSTRVKSKPIGVNPRESAAKNSTVISIVERRGLMHSTNYLAYLLRLRCVDNDGKPQWLITLQQPGDDGEEQFADLIALLRFLDDRMNDPIYHSKEDL